MYKGKMFAWMKSIGNKITGKRIETASTVLVISYTYFAITKTHTIPTFKTALDYLKTMKKPTVACLAQTNATLVQTSSSTDKGHTCTHEVEIQVEEGGSNGKKKAEKDFRIILLGATGSGKSLTGNVLLNDDKFKTSCFAKAETNHSDKKSTRKTLTLENIEKTCNIDIIDTPAVRDSGLTDHDVELEIQNAIRLAKPGPHAFIVCIPATSITNYYIDVIKRYEKYFDDEINDFIIVAFTRYEQFMPEFHDDKKKQQRFNQEIKNAINEHDILRRMNILNKYIVLKKDDVDKTKQMTKFIDVINSNRIKRAEAGKKEYAKAKGSSENKGSTTGTNY